MQNQTRPAVSQQSEQQALFAGLLREILHNPSADVETNVATNVQLVKVLVEAGLTVLTQDHPFAGEILAQQAIDSVSVIETTIRRQPGVLVASISQDGPPVALWLVARLAAIIGRPNTQSVPALRLLDNALQVLSESSKLWRVACDLREVLQESVLDLISSLETFDPITGFDLKVPPARSISKLWPQADGAIAAPHDCQTQIGNPAQACLLALQLSSVSTLDCVWQAEASLKIQRASWRLQPILRNLDAREMVAEWMLRLSTGAVRLQLLDHQMQHIMSDPTMSPKLQAALARSLLESLKMAKFQSCETLLSTANRLAASDSFPKLVVDLKVAITAWLTRFSSLMGRLPEQICFLQDAIRQDNAMIDGNSRISLSELVAVTDATVGGAPSRKRPKLRHPDQDQQRRLALRKLTHICSAIDSKDLASLSELTPDVYAKLDSSQQCAVWHSLTVLAGSEPRMPILVVSKLLRSQALQGNKRAKVLAMMTIQKCAEMTADPAVLDLTSSDLGRSCLQALQSTLRDLRIAAGSCLLAFLRHSLPSDIRDKNYHAALQWTKKLSDHEAPGIQETLIPVWGRIARVCNEDELNLVLLRLVDYTGSSNSLTRGLASTEIQGIAAHRNGSSEVEALMTPYWTTIAVSVVQELHSRPQKIQMLCDLLGKDVNSFLTMTQTYTLPSLVATKRRDVLARLAAARGPEVSVRNMCTQPRANLTAMLSNLLSQSVPDIEEHAMVCLAVIEPSFKGEDLGDYVKIDSTAIACELLKYAGDQGAESKSRAYHSFSILADLCERNSGQKRANFKSGRNVAIFLRRHILGILTGFSSVIEASSENKSFREKTRCLQATAEMIVLAKDEVSVALPQIRALLQSAIEEPRLCGPAWSAWLTLLPILDDDDTAMIVEQTFALIIEHWSTFSPDAQQRTQETVAAFVKEHNSVIHDRVLSLPSLSGIALLSKIGGEIGRLQAAESAESRYKAFTKRIRGENHTVVLQALRELVPFLKTHQGTIHDAAVSEKPSQYLSELVRSLLDVTVSLAHASSEAADLCGTALGLIGCLDPNRVDATRKKEHVLVLSNFDKADEVVRWVVVLLEEHLVKAFKSVTNTQAQGFMAYVIQEILQFCGFEQDAVLRPRATQTGRLSQSWMEMTEHVRTTLTPFLNSRYTVTTNASFNPPKRSYPGFSPDNSHSAWLRALVYDLTWKVKGPNAQMLFPLLSRIVRGHDLSIASFLLPYILINIVLEGTVGETSEIRHEILAVLQCQYENSAHFETVKLCSESLFGVLDYMSVWLQEKRKVVNETRAMAFRTGQSPRDYDEAKDMGQIGTIEQFLASIPAEVVATRAMDCGSYARALFNWEQFIRQSRPLIPSGSIPPGDEGMYNRLHAIYAQIDEPDGLEGISTHLSFLTEEQQATLHARSGRWTAAQAWYESKLADDPGNEDLQGALLHCLQETGRHSALLRYADSFLAASVSGSLSSAQHFVLPFAVGAAWMANDFAALRLKVAEIDATLSDDFSVGIGRLLIADMDGDSDGFHKLVDTIRKGIVSSMTPASTSSLQTSHPDLKKLHILSEVEILSAASKVDKISPQLFTILDKRLNVLGSYNSDKQTILAVRRALLRPNNGRLGERYVASSWLTTARLARKGEYIDSAYHAVLQASETGDRAAKLEEARLLWHDGHRRQAISAMEQAIASGLFDEDHESQAVATMSSSLSGHKQNMLSARARLLVAKWLDASGQSQTKEMTGKYQYAARTFQKWEKGHYYLGKHYFRLLEAEKALPKNKQTSQLLCGELTRLVIENLLRSVPFGNKYWHETIPKFLTLWMDLGMETQSKAAREDRDVFDKRVKALQSVHRHLRKYFDRMPPYIFFSALPQMLSRISHPHPDVWKELFQIITKVVATYPHQALWSLMAVTKATDKVRQERGREIINKLKFPETKSKPESSVDLRVLITAGQRLSDGLLQASEAPVDARASSASLSKDLGFNVKLAPCNLVVPIEATLTINLPPAADSARIRAHKPFVNDRITIQSFHDHVLVLSSLQRPKKVTLRGSDGKLYGLLCKPKDDLRKDQRLMEFNGIINRALKRDTEGSKRRLYIKTYAVTPLSEESGCLEWVEGIKPIRDILLNLYMRKGIRPNYAEIKNDLNEACKSPENVHIFNNKVQPQFPAALHEWFSEIYPEPDAWFASRLRYARSAAVMSMTGHVLGLGDRHGENILLQESTGGVFHVDFNCLFDKGMTFEKPEVVPFRLTRNMVDAMGPYGYEGPFRRSCELTMALLRQNKDTLMTMLETFLYDPTTDFVGKKKRTTPGVPETPREILDSVEGKLKGLLREETVALSVEGYVDALIREAVSPWNLCQMYIGWCSFL